MLRRLMYVLVFAVLAACATNPVTGKREVSLLSEAEEVSLGKESDAQVRQEYGIYDNPALQAYVNEVGQKLARQSHRSNLQWHFTVVDSPDINAFALPGGYIYITRGLMAYLNSEAELAGVLGHEIGHVTARHSAQRQTHGTIAQGVSVLAEVLGQAYLGVGGVGNVVGSAASGLILKYGREDELQADALGAEYLSRSGYDPATMLKVISVLKSQELFAADKARTEGKAAQRMPDWLSTHPSNDQRLQQMTSVAAKYRSGGGDAGKDRYLRTIDGMTFGDSPEQGLVRGSNFYHPALGIALSAPPGWQFHNAADALTVANPEGNAGVVLRGAPDGANHDDIIRQSFRPQSGQVQRTTINGLPATRFAGTATTREGQAVPLDATLVSVVRQNFMLQAAGQSAQALAAARGGINAVIGSFHQITDAERQLARPLALRAVNLPRGASLSTLAQQTPLTSLKEQQIRLINGYYQGGEPAGGQLIKTVVQK